jgi:hydroxymethylglutaryl-CoA lyase
MKDLRVHEVGLRDGLQNEPALVATEGKVRLLDALVAAGVRSFEATSFVSAKAVPQMADCEQILEATRKHEAIDASVLVVNEKGFDRALAAGATSIAYVLVVSETLSRKNSRMGVDDQIGLVRPILSRARAAAIRARVYVSPAWHCPYEGAIPLDAVLRAVDAAAEADELAISDTIGQAHPAEVGERLHAIASRFERTKIAAHLHDTQALGLANAAAAIEAGIRIIDASIGGLGGCPFAKGSAGNLATEDLVLLAGKMGLETGIDLEGLWRAVDVAQGLVDRPVGGRTGAWWRSRERAAACGAGVTQARAGAPQLSGG